MKTSITQDVPVKKFKPFTLNIAINSIDDAEKLNAIFDSSHIVHTIKFVDEADDIRKAIGSSSNGAIAYGSSNKWFNMLMRKIGQSTVME